MSALECLTTVRIGCVRYLNSRPLIAGLSGVRLEHPSDLARALRSGELDVALVPVYEAFRAPCGEYQFVDGVCIGSYGPVYSVFVAHRTPPETWTEVVADPASLTSVHLLQVLMRLAWNRSIQIVPLEKSTAQQRETASLWIGNQAIALRKKSAVPTDAGFWDLGQEWTRCTGLPFVYALWVMRKQALGPRALQIADAFREVARCGLESRERVAQEETEFGAEFARKYLSDHIRFELGEDQKRGMERYDRELRLSGFLPERSWEWEWV